METKSTISIKKTTITALLCCLFLGACAVFALNHLGKFTYIADTSNVENADEFGRPYLEVPIPVTNGVLSVTYTSYFGSIIKIDRPGFIVDDIRFEGMGKFNQYDNVSKYYINATIKDYNYILLVSVLLFTVYLFFRKFKIKLT
ncbi:hypothetical protein [Flavobacterium sp. H4147]|uniref:hypothetical protein n=1 Tax=Flavobacterium sp. H4147 TaxID=3034149 RepID=UPI0023ED2753|nr:hypothetical protein [Flavobacterium sp. H4147]